MFSPIQLMLLFIVLIQHRVKVMDIFYKQSSLYLISLTSKQLKQLKQVSAITSDSNSYLAYSFFTKYNIFQQFNKNWQIQSKQVINYFGTFQQQQIMSYSPSRIRRNSIFSEKRPRRSNLIKPQIAQPLSNDLMELERSLMNYFSKQTEALNHQIEQNNKTIEILQTRLIHNEEQISKKNFIIQSSGFAPGFIEGLVEAELNKRLNIVSKKFAEMQDAFVVNMLPAIENQPQSDRNNSDAENDILKLKGHMDEKLHEILINSNNNKDSLVNKCWQIGQQIRINEEVIQSMNSGIQNIRSKIFSLDTIIKTIHGKGEEIRNAMDGKISELREQLQKLNISIINIQNRLQNPMMKKHRQKETAKQVHIDRESRRLTERSQNPITNIRQLRRQVLQKDDISDISSISNSISFLPQPVFMPKAKTNPSVSSSPNSKFLANTKITTTLPLKIAKVPNSKILQDSSDEFLDLYRQSSFELTKQIMSPFQQAQYISSGNSPLDNTKSAFTIPLKPLKSNIQERVRETVFRKKLTTPIPGYLDNNNYIKKANGAYLFDWQGQVLKSNSQQFRRLCNIHLFVER